MQTKDGKLQWHPAFTAAVHIELEESLDILGIQDEYTLSKKPMQMDLLIIKKESGKKIKKEMGHIFRKHNIVEYKSPEDYMSINDFYKVYGYACIYQSNTEKICEIDPRELTITYVCYYYPRKMIQHLEKERGLKIRKYAPGIYYLEGDAIPIQIIITKELSKEEYYWLQNLRSDLKPGKEIQELVKRYEEKKTSKYYQAAMDLIVRANWEQMKEEKSMCDALRELFADELEESKNDGVQEGKRIGVQEGKRIGVREGKAIGVQEGRKIGIESVNSLNQKLAAQNRIDDIMKAASDSIYQEKLLREFGLQ